MKSEREYLLLWLLSLLHHISGNSEVNKMTSHNLSVCWSQNLFGTAENRDLQESIKDSETKISVLEQMIDRLPEIFDEERLKKVREKLNKFSAIEIASIRIKNSDFDKQRLRVSGDMMGGSFESTTSDLSPQAYDNDPLLMTYPPVTSGQRYPPDKHEPSVIIARSPPSTLSSLGSLDSQPIAPPRTKRSRPLSTLLPSRPNVERFVAASSHNYFLERSSKEVATKPGVPCERKRAAIVDSGFEDYHKHEDVNKTNQANCNGVKSDNNESILTNSRESLISMNSVSSDVREKRLSRQEHMDFDLSTDTDDRLSVNLPDAQSMKPQTDEESATADAPHPFIRSHDTRRRYRKSLPQLDNFFAKISHPVSNDSEISQQSVPSKSNDSQAAFTDKKNEFLPSFVRNHPEISPDNLERDMNPHSDHERWASCNPAEGYSVADKANDTRLNLGYSQSRIVLLSPHMASSTLNSITLQESEQSTVNALKRYSLPSEIKISHDKPATDTIYDEVNNHRLVTVSHSGSNLSSENMTATFQNDVHSTAPSYEHMDAEDAQSLATLSGLDSNMGSASNILSDASERRSKLPTYYEAVFQKQATSGSGTSDDNYPSCRSSATVNHSKPNFKESVKSSDHSCGAVNYSDMNSLSSSCNNKRISTLLKNATRPYSYSDSEDTSKNELIKRRNYHNKASEGLLTGSENTIRSDVLERLKQNRFLSAYPDFSQRSLSPDASSESSAPEPEGYTRRRRVSRKRSSDASRGKKIRVEVTRRKSDVAKSSLKVYGALPREPFISLSTPTDKPNQSRVTEVDVTETTASLTRVVSELQPLLSSSESKDRKSRIKTLRDADWHIELKQVNDPSLQPQHVQHTANAKRLPSIELDYVKQVRSSSGIRMGRSSLPEYNGESSKREAEGITELEKLVSCTAADLENSCQHDKHPVSQEHPKSRASIPSAEHPSDAADQESQKIASVPKIPHVSELVQRWQSPISHSDAVVRVKSCVVRRNASFNEPGSTLIKVPSRSHVDASEHFISDSKIPSSFLHSKPKQTSSSSSSKPQQTSSASLVYNFDAIRKNRLKDPRHRHSCLEFPVPSEYLTNGPVEISDKEDSRVITSISEKMEPDSRRLNNSNQNQQQTSMIVDGSTMSTVSRSHTICSSKSTHGEVVDSRVADIAKRFNAMKLSPGSNQNRQNLRISENRNLSNSLWKTATSPVIILDQNYARHDNSTKSSSALSNSSSISHVPNIINEVDTTPKRNPLAGNINSSDFATVESNSTQDMSNKSTQFEQSLNSEVKLSHQDYSNKADSSPSVNQRHSTIYSPRESNFSRVAAVQRRPSLQLFKESQKQEEKLKTSNDLRSSTAVANARHPTSHSADRKGLPVQISKTTSGKDHFHEDCSRVQPMIGKVSAGAGSAEQSPDHFKSATLPRSVKLASSHIRNPLDTRENPSTFSSDRGISWSVSKMINKFQK